MNNKFLKIMIIFLILLLLTISIVIAIIYHKEKVDPVDHIEEPGENFAENYGESENENGGVDEQAFYDINACMKKYLNTINMKSPQYGGYDENNNYVITVEETEIKEKIYNLLSQKYVNENNVTVENVYSYVKTLDKSTVYVPLEAALLENNNMKSFVIHGLIQDADNYNIVDEIFAVVNINITEGSFSIEPINEKYHSINEINIENFESVITPNKENKFTTQYISSEDIPAEYMNLYKRLTLGSPEKMYEKLDVAYRDAKFGSVEEFEKYVNKNKSKIELMRLERYQLTTNDDKVQYICMDQNNKYYIFKQKEVLQDYTVMLDTYTIDLQEFVEKYNNSEEKDKVALNIEKMKKAIQEEDYKYVYNKLDKTFRTNKFGNLTNFERYIKERYNANYTIKYERFQKVQDVCVFDLELTDGNITSEVQILMELKEGTDFVISFNEK